MYHPDYWVILKISANDPHNDPYYKVFGSWASSYLFGSSWRANSGIVSVEKLNNAYVFHGFSGSSYSCSEHMYDVHIQSRPVLDDFISRSNGLVEIMPEDTDWLNLDWMLSKP